MESGCEYFIEDFCFAKLCKGFIQLGLSSNLDFTAIGEDDDPNDSITYKKTMVINEDALISLGQYKNADFSLLKIPFFKSDEH